MAGNALETMVWSPTAMNMGSMTDGNTARKRAGVFAGSNDPLGVVNALSLMLAPLFIGGERRRANGKEVQIDHAAAQNRYIFLNIAPGDIPPRIEKPPDRFTIPIVGCVQGRGRERHESCETCRSRDCATKYHATPHD